VYRSVDRYPEVETFDGVLAVRVDAQFYFGNVTFLKETLQRLLRESSSPVRAVVINASTINHLDSSADGALQEIVTDFREHGIELFFANVRGPVLDVMKRSKLYDLIGPDHFEMSVTRAVTRAREHVASLSTPPDAPNQSQEAPASEPSPAPIMSMAN